MACNLGPDFLCSSIANLRGAEDTVTALIIVFTLGFVPFLLWKLMGAFRRIFLEKTSPLYGPFNQFGEVMEAVSALSIIIALVYMYVMLKPKKLTA